MRLYIAGPMTGIPDSNYPAFRKAEAELKAAGYEVLCPVDSEQHNDTGKQQTWDWYMRHALRMVLDAEGVALLPDWRTSRGAMLERHVANNLGLPTRTLDYWLDLAGSE